MPAKKVKFYAKRPNMEISIDGKIYKFEGGVLAVDPKLAEQVERHHLYRKTTSSWKRMRSQLMGKWFL